VRDNDLICFFMDEFMTQFNKDVVLHPRFLDALFAYKRKVSVIFKEVLGLHDMHHIAVSYIHHNQQLLSFSSTPSLEFNLFNSQLWQFDKTYDATWYNLCTTSSWPLLYVKQRFHELYYLKQLKTQLPLGFSFAVEALHGHFIYSMASHQSKQQTRELFIHELGHFYKIGHYCKKLLNPLFEHFYSEDLG
jgi:hypothetical protein